MKDVFTSILFYSLWLKRDGGHAPWRVSTFLLFLRQHPEGFRLLFLHPLNLSLRARVRLSLLQPVCSHCRHGYGRCVTLPFFKLIKQIPIRFYYPRVISEADYPNESSALIHSPRLLKWPVKLNGIQINKRSFSLATRSDIVHDDCNRLCIEWSRDGEYHCGCHSLEMGLNSYPRRPPMDFFQCVMTFVPNDFISLFSFSVRINAFLK